MVQQDTLSIFNLVVTYHWTMPKSLRSASIVATTRKLVYHYNSRMPDGHQTLLLTCHLSSNCGTNPDRLNIDKLADTK